MAKIASNNSKRLSKGRSGRHSNYDILKEIVGIASKNGWDIESLGLVRCDLPQVGTVKLTSKQTQERNRLIRKVLRRYSNVLTPPVPPDLEAP